jgi:hypothetical protein
MTPLIRLQFAVARRFWKSRCKVCGTVGQAWRMLPHWQPLNIPNTVAHRGGSLCKACHRELCGRRHLGGAMCAKDLGAALLPKLNLPHHDVDAILDDEVAG